MKPPVLMNLLGSLIQVTVSVKGVPGAWVGGANYLPCKHGNGVNVNETNEYVHFDGIPDILNKFIIAFWTKTPYSLSDGVASDTLSHVFFNIKSDALNEEYTFTIRAAAGAMMAIYSGTDSWLSQDVTSDWTAGDLVCIIVIVDRSASFDGVKTSAIYVNGVETDSDVTALSDRSGQANRNLYIGNYGTSPLYPAGIIDTLKIWDNIEDLSLIVAKRDYERHGLNDQIMAA